LRALCSACDRRLLGGNRGSWNFTDCHSLPIVVSGKDTAPGGAPVRIGLFSPRRVACQGSTLQWLNEQPQPICAMRLSRPITPDEYTRNQLPFARRSAPCEQ